MNVRLYNELGQYLYGQQAYANAHQIIIPVHELKAGLYIINLSNNNMNKSFKFILK
jgi:hypothetical protein